MENEKRAAVVADLDLDKLQALADIVDDNGLFKTSGDIREWIESARAALARSAAPAPAEPVATIRHDGTGWDAVMTEHGYRLCGAGLLDGAALYAVQPPAKPEAAPQAEQRAHDGSEHAPKELGAYKGEVSVEHHNGTKQTAKVGAIDWHRVVTYAAPASLPDVALPEQSVDWLGLALDLDQQAKRVESQTVERAMLAAARGLRLMGAAQPAEGSADAEFIDILKGAASEATDEWVAGFVRQHFGIRNVPAEGSAQVATERDTLAEAIASAAIKRGIIGPDTPLTGPQLVMLCADLAAPERSDTPAGLEQQLRGIQATYQNEPSAWRAVEECIRLARIDGDKQGAQGEKA